MNTETTAAQVKAGQHVWVKNELRLVQAVRLLPMDLVRIDFGGGSLTCRPSSTIYVHTSDEN